MSAPTGLVLPQMGGAQLPWVVSINPHGSSGAAGVANSGYFARVRVGRPLPITRMSCWVGTASGNVDLGIYQSDGTTLTRIASTGPTAVAGTNTTQTIVLTSAVTLAPGVDYYLAIAADNATATFARHVGNNPMAALENWQITAATVFPLPTSIALSGMAASDRYFVVWARP